MVSVSGLKLRNHQGWIREFPTLWLPFDPSPKKALTAVPAALNGRPAEEGWPRQVKVNLKCEGRRCGGRDTGAGTANSENSRWCDESKPQCKRCCSFGVVCNFMLNTSDLQPVADDSVRSRVARIDPRPAVTSAVWTSDPSTFYQLNAKCQDFLTRYLGRSLVTLTPDDPSIADVNRGLFALTFTHPFLMHASLAVALAYDRHLNIPLGGRRSVEECYHWSQSTALFNRRLQEPIKAADKDPIWGTAAALAVLSFATPDACTPEDSWPLKNSGSSELEWLRMSKGKMSLWRITDPLRPDSLFRVMAPAYAQMNAPLPERGVYGIPAALARVCGLDDSSTEANNRYFKAAHAVSQILDLSDHQVTTGQSELFPRTIHGSFKWLILEKDPVALLLLYLWYSKASRTIWWIELRARIECPAICLYLQTRHREYQDIHKFLPGGSHRLIS